MDDIFPLLGQDPASSPLKPLLDIIGRRVAKLGGKVLSPAHARVKLYDVLLVASVGSILDRHDAAKDALNRKDPVTRFELVPCL